MNILVDTFPQTLEVEGREYEINSDYRYALYTILAFEDKELTTYEKASIMLQNLFGENVPENVEVALEKCQWYLNAGKESNSDKSETRLYSFSQDDSLIFAAFQATHGIDLSTVNLHWWRFISLFMDLGESTSFCQLVGMRKRYYSGKATKEEKAQIREIGDIFFIDQSDSIMSLEDREKLEKVKESYKKAKEARNAGL